MAKDEALCKHGVMPRSRCSGYPHGVRGKYAARLAAGTSVVLTQTRAVLAGVYRKLDGHALLTHRVEVDRTGKPLRVFCGRVKLESLADSGATDTDAPPTCERCARETK